MPPLWRMLPPIRPKEVVWITDPDEDHGDFEGSSEGRSLVVSLFLNEVFFGFAHALGPAVCSSDSSVVSFFGCMLVP